MLPLQQLDEGWFVHLTSTPVLHDDPTEHSGRRDNRVDVALFGRCYHCLERAVPGRARKSHSREARRRLTSMESAAESTLN